MARTLSVAQKKVLNRYPEVMSFDDLPFDVQKQLYELRDFEILWQEATRYLSDRRMELLYGK